MTDNVWNQLHHVEAEIDDLQQRIRMAETIRNFGLGRVLAGQMRTAEIARDRVLSRLGDALAKA
jgi:hypothetical protein